MIQIYLPGKVIAKARPRIGRNNRMYNPEKSKNYQEQLSWLIKQECIKNSMYQPTKGPVRLYAIAEVINPIAKPDNDNLQKIILDAGTGILYEDDAQVVFASLEKIAVKKLSQCGLSARFVFK